MQIKFNWVNRWQLAASALSVAVLSGCAIHAIGADEGPDTQTMARAQLQAQTNIVHRRLQVLPEPARSSVDQAVALLICPDVQASRRASSECMLVEHGRWRAYYRLKMDAEILKASQSVVLALQSSRSLTQLLQTKASPAQSGISLSSSDVTLILLNRSDVATVPEFKGLQLTRIHL